MSKKFDQLDAFPRYKPVVMLTKCCNTANWCQPISGGIFCLDCKTLHEDYHEALYQVDSLPPPKEPEQVQLLIDGMLRQYTKAEIEAIRVYLEQQHTSRH